MKPRSADEAEGSAHMLTVPLKTAAAFQKQENSCRLPSPPAGPRPAAAAAAVAAAEVAAAVLLLLLLLLLMLLLVLPLVLRRMCAAQCC
jgi:fatty acid desaturase